MNPLALGALYTAALVACSPAPRTAHLSRRAESRTPPHTSPRTAITTCRAAFKSLAQDRTPEKNAEIIARECADIYVESACRTAWRSLRFGAGLRAFITRCRNVYCPLVGGSAVPLCRLERLPQDQTTYYSLWAPLERRILRRDFGETATEPLLAWKLRISQWMFLSALRIDTPRLSQPRRAPAHR